MTSKSLNEESNSDRNYYLGDASSQKENSASTEKIITTLRADMVPASEASPEEKSVFERINFKLIIGIFIILIILGVVIYIFTDAGRNKLQNSLVGLVGSTTTPTNVPAPSATNILYQVPNITGTSNPTSTTTPSPTKVIVITSTITLLLKSPTPGNTIISESIQTTTPASGCRDVNTITLADVGKTLCVQGIVIETVEKPSNFMVIFSTKKGAFYWVTYDMVWSKGEINKCYQISGMINQLANSPVLVFNYKNLPEECH